MVLAAAGANVVGIARRKDALATTEAAIEGAFSPICADLSDRSNLEAVAQEAIAVYGGVDIVVHAAGLNNRQPIAEITEQGWDDTINLNLSVPFFLSRLFVPHMSAQGWGRIVNFASLQSHRAFPNSLSYGASKGGVAQMTRAMAEAWSGQGITANAIGPGFFRTELTAPVFADPERAARNAAQTCIGRNGEPEDMDGPLLFLASEASAYVTGQVLMVDGGFTAK
jgi:NAD(P)-dependent dehydrogenase (short-subunit alcohol dehydrogenase family)